jgi:hypothetical protein
VGTLATMVVVAKTDCGGKTRYPTWQGAAIALQHLRRRGALDPFPGHCLTPYRCWRCKGWHLGNERRVRKPRRQLTNGRSRYD